jgi:bifunctional non-homologous end joining protein LigD
MAISMPPPLGFIKPEIPTLVPEPPSGEGWIHEIKHDGYRTVIIVDGGRVRALSRHGRDWTGPYRRVVEAAGNLSCQAAIIDGEIIVQDESGLSDFDALRSAIHKAPHRIVFFAFDLLHLDGLDLRRTPLIERRAALRRLIEPDPRSPIQFSDHADCNRALFLTLRPSSGLRASSPGGRPAPLSQRSIAIMAQDQEQGRERIHSPRHRPRLRRRALGAAGIGSGWPA